MVIQKLNKTLIEKIKGSFTINTLTQCAAELVLNSLDANSTAIAVRLNLITLKVQVIDNGDGISKDSMDLLGRRFYTSKCFDLKDLERNLKTHGYRGQALANISECSKSLTITSRRRNSSHTYSKTLGKGAGNDVRPVKERASAGTTVTVEGFFYCFPVRKRRIVAEVVLGDIKRYLETLLLMHPKVSFTLKNDVTNELILDSPKQDNVVSRFRHLHPDVLDVDFSLLKVSKGTTAVEGLLWKELSKFKNLQYLYVNKRPVHSTKTLKFISGLFLNRKNRQRENKHPIFVVNVKCPYAEVDLMLNSTETTVHFKHGNLVMRCLEKLVCTLFGEKTPRKPEEKTPEARPPSECSISKIKGAVQVKGFKRGPEKILSPSKENDDYDVSEIALEEPESLPLVKFIASENPHDEKGGKGLIMDMFLKSTRVFNSEESVETVFEEESNLCFEKSVTDMKKTTSVCMNVRSRRKLKKKHVKLQSTAVQTSFHAKEPKIPDGDFTIVFNNDKVDFVPKDPQQDQSVPMIAPQQCRKPDKDCKAFNLFALLPSPPRPPREHHSHPSHDVRFGHFQPPYQTNYYSGCHRNCCLQPPTNPYCGPNFYHTGCACQNCRDMPKTFLAPNINYEYEENRNKAHYFKPPQAEPVRFPNCCDVGCRHSNHNVARNFAVLQPGPAKFLNYQNLDYGCDNDYNMVRMVNSAKNPQGNSPEHNYRYKYDNNHDLGHRHEGNYVTQNIPQPNSPSRNTHNYKLYNYKNLEKNLPKCPAFDSNHGNHVDDLPETNKDLFAQTKKKESPKAFKEFKSDFLCTRKQRENIPDFCFNFPSAHIDEVDDEFNINFLNTHRDQTRENQRDVTEDNSKFMNVNKNEDNITEFTANFLRTCKDHGGVVEFSGNLSNQDATEFNPNFINAEKDEDNITEFTAKFLRTQHGQKDVVGFATNGVSELLQGNQGNPFQTETHTDNQEKCTMTFNIQDTNDESGEALRLKESKLPNDWVMKRKRKRSNLLLQYEN